MGLDSSGHWGTPHVADPVENAVYYHQRTRIFRYVQHIKLGLWSLKFLCLHSKVMYRQKASSVWVTETIPSNSAGRFFCWDEQWHSRGSTFLFTAVPVLLWVVDFMYFHSNWEYFMMSTLEIIANTSWGLRFASLYLNAANSFLQYKL